MQVGYLLFLEKSLMEKLFLFYILAYALAGWLKKLVPPDLVGHRRNKMVKRDFLCDWCTILLPPLSQYIYINYFTCQPQFPLPPLHSPTSLLPTPIQSSSQFRKRLVYIWINKAWPVKLKQHQSPPSSSRLGSLMNRLLKASSSTRDKPWSHC